MFASRVTLLWIKTERRSEPVVIPGGIIYRRPRGNSYYSGGIICRKPRRSPTCGEPGALESQELIRGKRNAQEAYI